MKFPFGKFVTPLFFHSCRLNSTHQKRALRLAYDVVEGATDVSPIVVLHGLFGSKSNWATMAKKMHKETQRTVFTVDTRNHGNSEHGDGMSTEAMRDDVLMLLKNDLKVDRCILIGHSLGGITSMVTALSEPQLIEKLVVVDVSPVRSSTHSIFHFPEYIVAMKGVQFDQSLSLFENRRSAGKQLQEVVTKNEMLQFLLTNVVEMDGRCQWRLNLAGLESGVQDILNTKASFESSYQGPVLFVKAGKSEYIRTEHFPVMKKLFPAFTVLIVEGASHFIHIDKPKEFLEAILPFLKI